GRRGRQPEVRAAVRGRRFSHHRAGRRRHHGCRQHPANHVPALTEPSQEGRYMKLGRKLGHMLGGAAAVWLLGSSAAFAATDVSDVPLFLPGAVPPLNMLVMARDHTLYYEAYNDASDLNGDGTPDVGYKPWEIDYFGYFDSHKCYA